MRIVMRCTAGIKMAAIDENDEQAAAVEADG